MNKLSQIWEKKSNLYWGIFAYIVILTSISWYKYYLLGYNALDLAIYNNVFYNAATGNGWWSSIQGHHYFADHFEPLLYILLPFYWLWSSPLNLLLWQSIIIASVSIPIYLIAKNIISQKLAVVLALAWLINPLAWNINLYEWHLLPLAIPLLLSAYYFYLKNNFKYYFIFLILALLVREDVAITVGGFFLLGLIEKKSLRWYLTPLFVSLGYFIVANIVISHFQTGGSRFQVYYEWLLNTNLWQFILHFFSLGNVEMILGLLLAFLFLPLLAGNYLILAFGPLFQFILGEPGGNNIIVDTHYASLFIPALIVSSIWGLKNIQNQKNKLHKFLWFDINLTKLIVVVTLIYLLLFLGPAWGVIKNLNPEKLWPQKILTTIPSEAKVAAGYKYLTPLSSRQNLYSLHYIFTGHQQFSQEKYEYQKPDYLVLDPDDMIYYALQFPQSKSYHQYYPAGFENIRKLLASYKLKYLNHSIMLWQISEQPSNFESVYSYAVTTGNEIDLGNFSLNTKTENNLIKLTWQIKENVSTDYFLQITTNHKKSYLRPLMYFYPTSTWKTENFYNSLLPIMPDEKISLQIVEIDGYIAIDGWRGTSPELKITPISETINLP